MNRVRKMPDDIVPGMLEKIERDFNREFNQSQIIKSILKDVEEGKGNYNKANRFAIEVGTILSRVFGRHITPETLPDGRMYFNIADRILNPTLRNNHKIIAELSAEVQEQLNKSINLG